MDGETMEEDTETLVSAIADFVVKIQEELHNYALNYTAILVPVMCRRTWLRLAPAFMNNKNYFNHDKATSSSTYKLS